MTDLILILSGFFVMVMVIMVTALLMLHDIKWLLQRILKEIDNGR